MHHPTSTSFPEGSIRGGGGVEAAVVVVVGRSKASGIMPSGLYSDHGATVRVVMAGVEAML